MAPLPGEELAGIVVSNGYVDRAGKIFQMDWEMSQASAILDHTW
jgi:hypothetical protein